MTLKTNALVAMLVTLVVGCAPDLHVVDVPVLRQSLTFTSSDLLHLEVVRQSAATCDDLMTDGFDFSALGDARLFRTSVNALALNTGTQTLDIPSLPANEALVFAAFVRSTAGVQHAAACVQDQSLPAGATTTINLVVAE